jgi:hypothetical protein
MKNKIDIIVLIVAFYFFSAMFFYFAYKDYVWMNYPTVEAKIVSCGNSVIIGDSFPTQDAVLRFYVDEVEYNVPNSNISTDKCKMKETMTLHYNPDDPNIININNVTYSFFFNIIIGTIIIVFIIVIVIIEFFSKKNTSKKHLNKK